MGLYTFFIYSYIQRILVQQDKKLNIASYNRLNERDCTILKRIQKGKNTL